MICPRCRSRTVVVETRALPGEVWRRRKCAGCAASSVTIEALAEDGARIPRPQRERRKPKKAALFTLQAVWR